MNDKNNLPPRRQHQRRPPRRSAALKSPAATTLAENNKQEVIAELEQAKVDLSSMWHRAKTRMATIVSRVMPPVVTKSITSIEPLSEADGKDEVTRLEIRSASIAKSIAVVERLLADLTSCDMVSTAATQAERPHEHQVARQRQRSPSSDMEYVLTQQQQDPVQKPKAGVQDKLDPPGTRRHLKPQGLSIKTTQEVQYRRRREQGRHTKLSPPGTRKYLRPRGLSNDMTSRVQHQVLITNLPGSLSCERTLVGTKVDDEIIDDSSVQVSRQQLLQVYADLRQTQRHARDSTQITSVYEMEYFEE